ncbi:MAG: M1 family metallopeptidase [Anaerolineae bacterium]|nr:M1 family metallopeptidase [Anaerolineae bacterium]
MRLVFKTHLLVLFASLIVLSGAGSGSLYAQDPATDYSAAMLPDFAGDIAGYADAPRYMLDLTLDVSDAEAMVSGHAAVTYTNRTPDTALDTLVFRLYPNLESFGGDMTVFNITAGETPVEPALDSTQSVLTIPLPSALEPGDSIIVEMDFDITLQAGRVRLYGQFSYLQGILSLPNAYPVLSVYEPDTGWWQAVEHPHGDAVFSETAFYTVSVTATADLKLAASGSVIDVVDHADGTQTQTFAAPLMRDFALMAGPAFETLAGEQDGTTVMIHYDPALPRAEDNAAAALEMAQNALRIYNAAYGPYPFAEIDVVQTNTNAGGIEYPGLIVVARDIWDIDNSFFEFVIAHEMAHQWWYSLVGNDQITDPWMDEALAQFSVAVYFRDVGGEAVYNGILDYYQDTYEDYTNSHDDRLIGGSIDSYDKDAYFYVVYEKAPLFYAALEDSYDYDTVLLLLQDYFAAYHYRWAESADMLASFEATTGDELDALFDEWVGDF